MAYPSEKRVPVRRSEWSLILALLLCVITLGGSQYLIMWYYSRDFRRRMASAGRCISVREAAVRCARGEGFLIQQTMGGWPVCRLWWASGDGFVGSGETADPATHHANYSRYLHEETGTALLVRPFIFSRSARRLVRRRFPSQDPKWIDDFWASLAEQ